MSEGAGGYNIPVSMSAAVSLPQTSSVYAGTVFNFGGSGRGDVYDIEQRQDSVATATSAAAQRDASAVTSDSGKIMDSQGLDIKSPWVIGGVAVGAVVLLVLARKFF